MVRMSSAALCVLLSIACRDRPTGPGSHDGPVRIEASIGQSVLTRGDTTSLIFRLRNLGAVTVTLNFSSGCQLVPYVRDERSAAIVYPAGGGWVCTAVLSALTLAPGAEVVGSVPLYAGASAPFGSPATPLVAGSYSAFAEVVSAQQQVRSATVGFIVR